MSFLKGETQIWLRYSKENFDSANVLLKNNLFNPCLQNVQQAVEKALKALLIEKGERLKKTHDILELKKKLEMLKKNISNQQKKASKHRSDTSCPMNKKYRKLQDSLDLPDKDLAKYIRIPKSTLALRKKRNQTQENAFLNKMFCPNSVNSL